MRIEQKRDLGWAVLIGAIFAASPLTGAARLGVSIALGCLFTAVVYLGRRLIRPRLPHLFTQDSTERVFAPLPVATWTLLVASFLAFAPTMVWLWEEYTETVWRNVHGLFVPVVVFVLARARLRREIDCTVASSGWGAPVLLLGVCFALVDSGVRSGYLGTVGLIIAVHGLSLLLLGSARTRAIAFPLALMFFLLPAPPHYPDPFGLTTGTSFMMDKYLRLLDIPVYLHHQAYFTLPVGVISVSTNCGGIAFFYSACLVAVVLVTTTTSTLRRVLIVLSIWPLTIVINGVRGTILVLISNYYGFEASETAVHGLTGIWTFWAVTCGQLLFADWRAMLGSGGRS